MSLIPQAAFFDHSEARWIHATAGEIDDGLLAKRPDYKKGPIRLFARSSDEYHGLVSKLGEHGVHYHKSGELHPPEGLLEAKEMEVEVKLIINKGIRRCVAKYAFNYLAHVCGSEFVRGADFDSIRQFIRYGVDSAHPLVVAGSRPILYDELTSSRRTGGHLLTLSWTDSLSDLVGEVSLFNSIKYRVWLCRQFGGKLWRPIRRGVQYDLEQKAAKPLIGVSKALVPS